jgi:hypothetical protein
LARFVQAPEFSHSAISAELTLVRARQFRIKQTAAKIASLDSAPMNWYLFSFVSPPNLLFLFAFQGCVCAKEIWESAGEQFGCAWPVIEITGAWPAGEWVLTGCQYIILQRRVIVFARAPFAAQKGSGTVT